MDPAARAEIEALLRRRLADEEAAERTAARAGREADLAASCVGGKDIRTEIQQRRDAARGAATRRLAARARLAAALARFGRPDFGLCTECGAPIPLARLRADPAATRCTDCAGPRR
jgi:DnaK suppressor protein